MSSRLGIFALTNFEMADINIHEVDGSTVNKHITSQDLLDLFLKILLGVRQIQRHQLVGMLVVVMKMQQQRQVEK